MSLYKFYDTSKTESQKTGYRNFWDYSINKIDGDFIMSWGHLYDDETTTVYLEELAPTALYNGEIDVLSSVDISALGYTTGYGNSQIYADKQVYALTGVHRLKLSLATTPSATILYGDIFYNINNDIPTYTRLYAMTYVRVYRY